MFGIFDESLSLVTVETLLFDRYLKLKIIRKIMNRTQIKFAVVILLAMAIFYFVGVALEEQLGATGVLIGGLLAVGIIFLPFLWKKK